MQFYNVVGNKSDKECGMTINCSSVIKFHVNLHRCLLITEPNLKLQYKTLLWNKLEVKQSTISLNSSSVQGYRCVLIRSETTDN